MIKRNENRLGYKKTKVGWIPEDWYTLRLSALVHSDKPIVYGIVQAGPHIPDGIPYIRSTNVGPSVVPTVGLLRTSPEIAARYARAAVMHGDVVFSLRGNIGKTSIVPEALSGANLTQGTARISVNNNTRALFVHHTLASACLRRLVHAWAKGSTFREITIDDLRKLPLPLPSLLEQEAIVGVLECWDKAIWSYEKKIEKKRNIKKGLMQHLLHGKQHLPGFSEKWKDVRLGEIVDLIKEKVGDRTAVPMSLSAGIGFVSQAEKFGRDISGEQYRHYTLLPKGCFAYNKGNSKRYPQGCIYLLEEHDQVAVPNVFISFEMKPSVAVNDFFKQVFLANFHGRELVRYINSGVRNDGLLNLNTANFLKIKISLPSIREQRAIAAILSEADAELAGLERKLAIMKGQKRFLLDNLVMGTIRLPQFVGAEQTADTKGGTE